MTSLNCSEIVTILLCEHMFHKHHNCFSIILKCIEIPNGTLVYNVAMMGQT